MVGDIRTSYSVSKYQYKTPTTNFPRKGQAAFNVISHQSPLSRSLSYALLTFSLQFIQFALYVIFIRIGKGFVLLGEILIDVCTL
jgi:hypothetical protein